MSVIAAVRRNVTLQSIHLDVWINVVCEFLDDVDLLAMQRVSEYFKTITPMNRVRLRKQYERYVRKLFAPPNCLPAWQVLTHIAMMLSFGNIVDGVVPADHHKVLREMFVVLNTANEFRCVGHCATFASLFIKFKTMVETPTRSTR